MHAAPALPELQRRFLAALYDDDESGPVETITGNGLEPSARLRIYRRSCNEIQTGALRATYPAVLALVGAAFFDQTSRSYRSRYPSGSGNLQGFGGRFADHLETLPTMRELAYLPDVARLEWSRQQVVLAADAEPAPPDVLARQLEGTDALPRLALQPSVQCLASHHPVLTIWRYAMDPTPDDLQLTGAGEQVVLWREDAEVAMATPDAASFACIEALAHGNTVTTAHTAAKALDPDFDLPVCLASLAERGLIAALDRTTPHQEHPSCR